MASFFLVFMILHRGRWPGSRPGLPGHLPHARRLPGGTTPACAIAPERSLSRRIGECLQGLDGRGIPDEHLLADRVPALLDSWYSGSVTPLTCEN